MIDGKLSDNEWTDARQTALRDGVELYIKVHEPFVLIAIALPKGRYGFTDLIINENLDLHASAKLGERVRASQGNWPEWSWWNNDRWTANTTRVDDFAGPRLLKENVREYQIRRERFTGNDIRVEVLSTIMKDKQRDAEWHSESLTFHLP